MSGICAVRHTPYVVSLDVDLILRQWTEDGREHRARGFTTVDNSFLASHRARMKKKLTEIFPELDIIFVESEKIKDGIHTLVGQRDMPVLAFDKVYYRKDFHIETTRLVNENLDSIGDGSRTATPIEDQLDQAEMLFSGQAVQLVDDVVFSGGNLVRAIGQLAERGIAVKRIVSGVAIEKGRALVLENYPDLEFVQVEHFEDVVDEVCERDFYPGLPLSGKLIGQKKSGFPAPIEPETGAPYLLPFGNPVGDASIPAEHAEEWSRFCIKLAIELWTEIENRSGSPILCEDLPRTPRGIPRGKTRLVEELARFV